MAETVTLVPLHQWRQMQPSTTVAATLTSLLAGQLYALDGGIFRARQDDDGRWQLWTWMGQAGPEVTRTGFEVDVAGGIYDRLYDVVDEVALVLTPARFTIRDLMPVTQEEAMPVENSMTVKEFAERYPELYDAVQGEIGRDDVGQERR